MERRRGNRPVPDDLVGEREGVRVLYGLGQASGWGGVGWVGMVLWYGAVNFYASVHFSATNN